MYTARKHSNTVIHTFISLLILASVLMPSAQITLASEETSDEAGAMVLVLEDCDSDNKLLTDPYGDVAFLLNSECELVRKFHNFSISSAFCGHRKISVSEDGRFYLVRENMPGKLTMYETATCRELWTLWMDFRSAVFADNLIYAVNTYNVFAIDNTGTIVKHSRIGGLDIAVDSKHDCLWIVGSDVKKLNLDLQIDSKAKFTLDLILTGGFSVDVNPDGSIWVAERYISENYSRKNHLVKISPDGSILRTIGLTFLPVCVRIDRSDGSVWTTGIIKERDFSRIDDELPETLNELNDLVKIVTETFTCKYDSEGNLIFEINEGGYSIELDQSDSSAWIADKTNIWHYSAEGRNLGSYTGSPDAQKWLAIVPGTRPKQINSRQ